ncbi:MAG: hypothetical protein QM396_02760 [Euryarchaeota archaeon]|jgi:hypothetical protein|uniref:hypothetical protein n=1 Tax=Methanobacterium sp. MZD130B TaxID=3394378 RepID=UPI0039FBA3E1|nr:hypothetical protein [Euryarchaeota archaeon]
MEEIKEIKSVTIVPFTLMNSALSAILGLIYALILIIVLGLVAFFIPSTVSAIIGLLLTLAVAIILILPTGLFLVNIAHSFLQALIYNLLVPRLGGIKLKLDEMEEIKEIPIIPLSLMVSTLNTIYVLILMLIVAPILMLGMQTAAIAAISTTSSLPEFGGLSALGIIGIIMMIIGIPIIVFISSFINTAIMALIYNFLAPKIGGIRLKFNSVQNNLFELKKIEPIPLALILAVVTTILNLIFSIPNITIYFTLKEPLFAIAYLIGNIVGTFIIVFIMSTVTALIYNFLRPTIGGIELELE